MILKINDQEFTVDRQPVHITVSPEEAAVLILRLQKIADDRNGPRGRIELHVNTTPGSEMNSYWRLTNEDFLPVQTEE